MFPLMNSETSGGFNPQDRHQSFAIAPQFSAGFTPTLQISATACIAKDTDNDDVLAVPPTTLHRPSHRPYDDATRRASKIGLR